MRIMKSYTENHQIDFCFVHSVEFGFSFMQHAIIKVIAKVIGEYGVISEKEVIYDPWTSIKRTFFTRLYLHHIQQTDLKANPGFFF